MKRLCFILILLALPAWSAPDLEAGRKLLSHYGWTCGTSSVEMSYTVDPSMTGMPQTFYQSASKQIGLDLTPAAGQEITLVRFLLEKRSHESNSSLYAHVAYFKSHIIGAWLSTNAPIAPGIASLDSSDFGHNF